MTLSLRGLRISPFPIWILILGVLMLFGVVAGGIVFTQGLVVTNLSDVVPWGLWITVDLSAIALSAGAFLLCATVYILGLKKYQPIARTATFIGLIGYSVAMLMLLLDIGRPDRFWHAFVFWNPHSVLWEVTMCVGLYFTVLVLETLPILGESDWMQSRWPKIGEQLASAHRIAPFLAIAGLGLSMLHQSSLGATYGVLKSRPIWYRPGLSVLFIISAAAGGIALTTLASMLAGRFSDKAKVKDDLLENLARAVGWILLGFLYFRFWDMFSMTYTHQPGRDEGLRILTNGVLAFNFWFGEILLGIIIPAVILLNGRLRKHKILRIAALALIIGGVVAYRWDTNLVGQLVVLTYFPHDIAAVYTRYFPSLIEFMAAAGAIAYALLAFTLGVRYLNIVDHSRAYGEEEVEVQAYASAGD